MRAEASASELFASLGTYTLGDPSLLGTCPSWKALEREANQSLSDSCFRKGNGKEGIACFVKVTGNLCDSPSGAYIIALGAVFPEDENTLVAESLPLMVEICQDYRFDDAIVGCEVVRLEQGAGVTGGVVSGGDVTISGGVYPPTMSSRRV